MTDVPHSFRVERTEFDSLGEVLQRIIDTAGHQPFALVITLCDEISFQEMSNFAASLVSFDCRTVYSRGAGCERLEYAIDTADVLARLSPSSDKLGGDRFVLTATTDDSVELCLFLIEHAVDKVDVAILATQTCRR